MELRNNFLLLRTKTTLFFDMSLNLWTSPAINSAFYIGPSLLFLWQANWKIILYLSEDLQILTYFKSMDVTCGSKAAKSLVHDAHQGVKRDDYWYFLYCRQSLRKYYFSNVSNVKTFKTDFTVLFLAEKYINYFFVCCVSRVQLFISKALNFNFVEHRSTFVRNCY